VRIIIAALLLLAAVAPTAGVPWLSRAAWPQRVPRAGIAAWMACSLAILVSLVLAGVILAVPCIQISTNPATLRACLSLLRAQYASPAGAVTGTAGALLAAAVGGRVAWAYGSVLAAARRRRSAHDDVLAVIARPGPASDVRIIDGDRPAVYCLPGRRRIVLTTGALTRLDDGELDAVLAHERAHLSGRHHIVLALAAALQRAFPPVRFFRLAARQVAYLVEMAADDAAVRRAPRLTVASALLAVATAGVPAGALGAGGSAAAQRIQRLINPPPQDSKARRAVTYATLGAAAALAITAFGVAFMTLMKCPTAPHL
jgi:Zn-dependent protease with chaperone function